MFYQKIHGLYLSIATVTSQQSLLITQQSFSKVANNSANLEPKMKHNEHLVTEPLYWHKSFTFLLPKYLWNSHFRIYVSHVDSRSASLVRRAATVFLQCSCCLHHSIAADTKPTTAKKTRGRENFRGTGKPFPVIHLPVVPTAGQKRGNVADKIKKSSYSFCHETAFKNLWEFLYECANNGRFKGTVSQKFCFNWDCGVLDYRTYRYAGTT